MSLDFGQCCYLPRSLLLRELILASALRSITRTVSYFFMYRALSLITRFSLYLPSQCFSHSLLLPCIITLLYVLLCERAHFFTYTLYLVLILSKLICMLVCMSTYALPFLYAIPFRWKSSPRDFSRGEYYGRLRQPPYIYNYISSHGERKRRVERLRVST